MILPLDYETVAKCEWTYGETCMFKNVLFILVKLIIDACQATCSVLLVKIIQKYDQLNTNDIMPYATHCLPVIYYRERGTWITMFLTAS